MAETITGLDSAVIEKIKSVLSAHPEIKRAILYGSRAKGNFKPYSDIDMTLVGDALNLNILHAIENEIDDLLLPYTLDISIYHHIQNPDLVGHIDRVGKDFNDL